MELAARCEAATETQAPFCLIDAHEAVCGLPYRAEQSRYFRGLIEAQAYLDAAMTLVPEGWEVALYYGVRIFKPEAQLETEERRIQGSKPISGMAETIALALCAAALRARASTGQSVMEIEK